MATCPGRIIIPRYSTSCASNVHFSSLRNNFSLWRISNTICVRSLCSSSFSEKISTSSMYTINHPSRILFCEDFVHVSLEGGWGVAETEKHDIGFEQPISCRKDCLPAIVGVDAYIVITGPDVDLGEVLGIVEFCNEGRD